MTRAVTPDGQSPCVGRAKPPPQGPLGKPCPTVEPPPISQRLPTSGTRLPGSGGPSLSSLPQSLSGNPATGISLNQQLQHLTALLLPSAHGSDVHTVRQNPRPPQTGQVDGELQCPWFVLQTRTHFNKGASDNED